jgi:putative N6-adenine-specific DNA methylase
MDYKIIATTTFGLEAVASRELNKIGYNDLTVEDGRITFEGDEMDIAICNTWLRTADRVLIQMAKFQAKDFEELYQGTLAVNWGSLIPVNGIMHVNGCSRYPARSSFRRRHPRTPTSR